MNGELEVGGGEAESLPGVIGDGEGLIEAGVEGLEKGGVGRGGNGGIDKGETNGALSINKGLERDVEAGNWPL